MLLSFQSGLGLLAAQVVDPLDRGLIMLHQYLWQKSLAIGTAIDELVHCETPNIILSVFTSLQNVSQKSPSIIVWYHNKISAILNRVPILHICWVPGHCGIHLNKWAINWQGVLGVVRL